MNKNQFVLGLSLLLAIANVSTAQMADSFVDDAEIKKQLYLTGQQMLESDNVSASQLLEDMETVPESFAFSSEKRTAESDDIDISRNYQSTVVIGCLYDCGRCDKKHLTTAGGVVISSDGLILTNHHVLLQHEESFNFFVMTRDRKVHPIIEVLAADEAKDLALVRIEAEDLVPANIAQQQSVPNSNIYLISHPHGRFYSTDRGTVSRYSTKRDKDGLRRKWMEVNAMFSQGSSGCGVFNAKGELTGLISRKEVLRKRLSRDNSEVEMVVRLCVPQSSIEKFLSGAEDEVEKEIPPKSKETKSLQNQDEY